MHDLDRRHKTQRRLILQYLILAGFRWIPPRSLMLELRDKGYATSWKTLNFHLGFLEDEGWVKVERGRMSEAALAEDEEIKGVMVTAAGVKAHDRGDLDER
jgi:repressor of nif and glnA expression